MVWQPLARHLTGYHAVAPDLRGQGDSSPPVGRAMDWAGFADDVLAVVDAWEVDDLVAVGHSKGGAALLLAEQRRPGTFRALWLYEPVVFPSGATIGPSPTGSPSSPSEPSNPLAEGALRRRSTFASRQAAYDNYRSKPPLSVLDPAALHAYVDHGFDDQPDGTVALKCRPEVESAIFRMASDNGAFGHLGQVSCPVTIARGVGGLVRTRCLRPARGRRAAPGPAGHVRPPGPLRAPGATCRGGRGHRGRLRRPDLTAGAAMPTRGATGPRGVAPPA